MTIEFTRSGAGKPVIVFVHGFGCARGDWDPQVRHFSPRHETIAVDLGGHGTSPGNQSHRRIETHGADVATLLARESLRQVVLVGHSMGCRVIMEAALREPARVIGLMLVDGSRMGAPGAKDYLDLARAIETKGYANFIRPAFAAMFTPDYPKAAAEAIIERAAARPAAIAGPLFADIRRWDSEVLDSVLQRLKAPLFALQSTRLDEQGRRLSMRAGETSPYLELLRGTLPDVTVEVVPDIGHFTQLERSTVVNSALERFVARLTRA